MGAATTSVAESSTPSAVTAGQPLQPRGQGSTSPPTPNAYANPTYSLTGAAPLPSTSSFSPGSLAAGLFLAALAAAAFVMARRKRRAPRLIEVLETASLGPKRAIVVARLGDEILVLGSSEGGVALLSTRPASALRGTARPAAQQEEALRGAFAAQPPPPAHDAALPRPAAHGAKGRVLDLLSRLKPRARPAPTFETALGESLEDLELRRKLAAGLSGQAGGPQSGGAR